MDYNIIEKYINFVKRELLEFFNITLNNNYKKSLCNLFIERYINVRYYDETSYPNEKDFVKRLNKELLDIYYEMKNNDNEESMKYIIALFGYVIYFDEVYSDITDTKIIDVLLNDDVFKFEDSLKTELKRWFINYKKSKEKLKDIIFTKDFDLIEKKAGRRLYYLDLSHNVTISNLYSEYAIDKAYNSGIVNEDKLFILYILSTYNVLSNSFTLNFNSKYIVPIADTLFEKEKKLRRLLNIINSPLAKKFISIKFSNKIYLENKVLVNKLIKEGYSFCIELDDSYDFNINELILFNYILFKKDNEIYEFLNENKRKLKSKIVKL